MDCWPRQPTSSKELCDAIDEIMKPGQEDVLPDGTLSSETPLEFDIELSDLLETPPVTSTMSPLSSPTAIDYNQARNIYDIPSTSQRSYPINNNSQSNAAASAYSSLGISPKFTTLSINQHHPFSPPPPLQDTNNSSTLLKSFVQSGIPINSKSSLHPPPFVQEQQNTSILGTSYPLELQMNSGLADVKRFRSSSMNEGVTQSQIKLDPYRSELSHLKIPDYLNPSYYQNRTVSSSNITTTTTSSTSSLSTDVSSNAAWPFTGGPRPVSSSFSEVLSQQQQQLRTNNNFSTTYGSTPSFYSIQQRNQTGLLPDLNFQPQQAANCTLYSLNQSTGGATSSTPPPALTSQGRQKASLAGFPIQHIKDDPGSPTYLLEQQSEGDLWSDIEQNSSDQMRDYDIEGDDIMSDDDDRETVSTGLNTNLTTTKSTHPHANSSSLFWQYNVQAKGPKTKRILYLKERDPHKVREFTDPVYQIKLTQANGQTFTKLRKGDGNDVTPNAFKLYQLGKQIQDLSAFANKTATNTTSLFHGIYHAEQQTSNSNDSAEVKKEKNKIASRACRLRKKAQHEANKLKLHGLNEEHRNLMNLMTSIKLLILKRFRDGQINSPLTLPNQSLEAALDQLIANHNITRVAGNTDGFIQTVIGDMERLYASKQQRSSSLNT